IVYAVWAKLGSTDHTIEPVGLIGLILTGGLCLIIGTFFEFVARRLEQPRPEDNPRAEVSDGAGEVGFFSPGSYWPIVLALSAAIVGVALAFWLVWLLVTGIIMLLIMVGGLVFEYHIGTNHD
ncbi:MAG TPA: cytochrome c oxidase subunit 4, partial [Pseudonocardiaceae bacterium]